MGKLITEGNDAGGDDLAVACRFIHRAPADRRFYWGPSALTLSVVHSHAEVRDSMMAKQPVKKHVIDVEDDTPLPLDIDPAAVEFIIVKARAFDAKTAPVEPDPGSNELDDGERGILEDYPSDQTQTELRDAIDQLSDDAALDLLGLYWVGRGDFGREEWGQAREQAGERTGRALSAYLMNEPQLGDFLEEGLTALGYTPREFGPA